MRKVNALEACYALSRGLRMSGGATASLDGEILTEGVSVSLRPDLEHIFTDDTTYPTSYTIRMWLETLPELQTNAAVGIWQDPKGKIYLDVVHVYNNDQLDQAMVVAKFCGQRSIYHLERGELIWI